MRRTSRSEAPGDAQVTDAWPVAPPPSQHPQLHRHILIEHVSPMVDCGRYPAKGIMGDRCVVEADAFRDGHDRIRVAIIWRRKDSDQWQQAQMQPIGNDRWRGDFPLADNTRYVFAIEAWTDHFATWQDWTRRKIDAGQDIATELAEGRQFIAQVLPDANEVDATVLKEIDVLLSASRRNPQVALAVLQDPAWEAAMLRLDPRADLVTSCPVLEVTADRPLARFSAWYEFFPRSAGTEPGEHATFRQAERRLADIKAMGFDIVYLPPIHPIGHTARKGKNNSLEAGPDDPGSPWAIGNEHGGHTAIEPKLGTLDDFDHFVATARQVGLEVALDFAIQCSPDHPWVKQHPAWFRHRPDGTIKYAENPPKKYQDIYPINFDSPDAANLWAALLEVVRFWIARGVTVFRVDNPHTKPVPFWEWLIATVQAERPEILFLSEAFTMPKMMATLAKAGFSQSYTYFTWRTSKYDLESYLRELTQTEMQQYFRANFWPNTPDILPPILQTGGRPAFQSRLVLAATLSPSYGIYSGYELCEGTPLPEREEYLDSEKYEIKVRDWHAPGNLVAYVTRLNEIRQANPALQQYTNLRFLDVDNDQLIAYAKTCPESDNLLLIVVNLDPHATQEGMVQVPADVAGVGSAGGFEVIDLLSDIPYRWRAGRNYVRLDPQLGPAHILRVERRLP